MDDLWYAPDDHSGWEVEVIHPKSLLAALAAAGGIKGWKGELPWYIRYDKLVEPQYRRGEQIAHDGTLLFPHQLALDLLAPLVERRSFWRKEPRPSDRHLPVYTVGDVTRYIHMQTVDVPAGKISGQVERLRLPTRVEWLDLDGDTVPDWLNELEKSQ